MGTVLDNAAGAALLALVVVATGCDLGTYDGGDAIDAGNTARYHPTGFAVASVHGVEMTMQQQNCTSCHAEDLGGVAAAVSCDGCHTPAEPQAWQSDCTFCHGGELDPTGAPPTNLDGTAGAGVFPAHTAHVNAGAKAAGFDCVQCHTKATDVLSLGHAFDDSPGIAEVDLGGGLSGLATYDRATGCADTFCHGNGRGDNGTVLANAGPMTCVSCHPNQTSAATEKDEMSGSHTLHLGIADVNCGECHDQTSLDGATIVNVAMHVNGERDIGFAEAGFIMDRNEMTCTGNCHGRDHQALVWVRANGKFHPDDYAEADAHGPEMELQRMNCRGCHEADLTGKGNAPSCDSCHDADDPTAWRSDCTFCHGGDETPGGAPPRDLGAGAAATSLSFRAHTVHVTQGISAALECSECHTTPTDVLSPGHAFDSTAAVAEVVFSGLAQDATYNTGTCSNLYCHGNGRANGTIADGSPARACDSCHPGMNSNENQWDQMSGEHKKHLKDGMDCSDCHETVTLDGRSVANPLLHVNGQNEIKMSENSIVLVPDPARVRCDGPCHGENHSNETW